MAVRKRSGVWHYEFMVRGTRYYGNFPVAKTKREASDAEAEERKKVHNGTYGQETGLDEFGKFVDVIYLKYSKAHKASWRHDEFRCEVLKKYFKGKRFRDITSMLVEKYIKDRLNTTTVRKEQVSADTTRQRRRSPVTVHKEVSVLSSIFNMAIQERITSENPCRFIRKAVRKNIKARNKRERFLSYEEESRLMAALMGRREHLRPLVELALQTGMRLGELLALRWEHVNLGALPLYFIIDGEDVEVSPDYLLVERSKNGKPRTVPLSPAARKLLARILDTANRHDYVFPGKKSGYGLSSIKKSFPNACRAAGIPTGVNIPNGLVFHDLRHTWATRAAQAGVDPYTIRDILGHATVKMSNDYTHSTPESQKWAVEAVNRLSQKGDLIYGKFTASG